MVVPLYISEISPPEIRGSLLVFEEFSIVFGIVLSFWITYATRYIPSSTSWQLPFALQMVPGLLLGVGAFFFLPFSPRWLASKGRENEALVILAKLRRLPESDARVRREWVDIIAESEFQRQILEERHPSLVARTQKNRLKLEVHSWTDCLKPGCWRRTHVGAGLMFFQQVNTPLFPSHGNKLLTASVCWYQCTDILLPHVIRVSQLGIFSTFPNDPQNDGPERLHATHHVRHTQYHSTFWRDLKLMDA